MQDCVFKDKKTDEQNQIIECTLKNEKKWKESSGVKEGLSDLGNHVLV